MVPRRLLLVFVIVSVALAGCTSLPGQDTSSDDSDQTIETATPATDASNTSDDAEGPENGTADGAEGPDDVSTSNASSDAADSRNASRVRRASVGETIGNDHLALTVHSAAYVTHLPERNVSLKAAAENEQFVVADVTIENRDRRTRRLDEDDLDAHLLDSDGYVYSGVHVDDAFLDVALLPQTPRRGELILKAPRSASSLTLFVTTNVSPRLRGRYDLPNGSLRYSLEHATKPRPGGTIEIVSTDHRYAYASGEVRINNTADVAWTPVVDIYMQHPPWDHTEENATDHLRLDPHEETTVEFSVSEPVPEPGEYYVKAFLRQKDSDERIDEAFSGLTFR